MHIEVRGIAEDIKMSVKPVQIFKTSVKLKIDHAQAVKRAAISEANRQKTLGEWRDPLQTGKVAAAICRLSEK